MFTEILAKIELFAGGLWSSIASVSQMRGMQLIFGFILIFMIYDIMKKGLKKSLSRRAVKGFFASIAIIHLNAIFAPFIVVGVIVFQHLYGALGIPSLPVSFWEAMPLPVSVLAVIASKDFLDYWNHRFMHTSALWPIHAMHHSDEEVMGATTFRVHFLEALMMSVTAIFFLSWLGLPADAIGIGAILLLFHNVYVHADLPWDHGPFRDVVASPAFHRWHHANEPAAFGKNLANFFPVFDRMFGTYYYPGVCDKPMGANGIPHADVVSLFAYPFIEYAKPLKKIFKIGKREKVPPPQETSRQPAE